MSRLASGVTMIQSRSIGASSQFIAQLPHLGHHQDGLPPADVNASRRARFDLLHGDVYTTCAPHKHHHMVTSSTRPSPSRRVDFVE